LPSAVTLGFFISWLFALVGYFLYNIPYNTEIEYFLFRAASQTTCAGLSLYVANRTWKIFESQSKEDFLQFGPPSIFAGILLAVVFTSVLEQQPARLATFKRRLVAVLAILGAGKEAWDEIMNALNGEQPNEEANDIDQPQHANEADNEPTIRTGTNQDLEAQRNRQ